jgi:cell division protein FtsA
VQNGLIAALDIGSSKICCFVACATADESLRVIGIGHRISEGIRAGDVIDMEAAEHVIRSAVEAAEDMARERVAKVLINVSAGRPSSRSTYMEVSIAGHEVGNADIRLAIEEGRRTHTADDRSLLHIVPTSYAIDDSHGIRDPSGMYGDKLGVTMNLVTAASGAVRNLATCVRRCHLEIEELVLSPYASGLSCLVDDELDLGVTLIDMGGGTTGIAGFLGGRIVYAESLPIGGAHVTNDIARGLATPLAHAERLKTLYGNAIASPSDETTVIDVPLVGEENRTGPNHVPRARLIEIIRPRIEETFELVRDRIEASGIDALVGSRVVLTGGASQLPGVRELAAEILDKQIRLGRPAHINGLAEATNGPAFSTCAGLLSFALRNDTKPLNAQRRAVKEPAGHLERIGHWLRENF